MYPAPLASNPANGINNIPLNNAGSDSGGSGSLDPAEALQKIKNILRQGDLKSPGVQSELYQMRTNCQNEEWKSYIDAIIKSSSSGLGDGPSTINPDTGKPYSSSKQLLRELSHLLQQEVVKNKQMKTEVTAQAKKKKKDSRGNPFRVLMGKVGKLLDHGLEKKDIVRYLAKEKWWNEETIDKAVKIVKDYNKKKRRDTKEIETEKKSFNYNSFVKTAGSDATDYDFEPDFKKRSLGELFSRLEWLSSLDKATAKSSHSDGRTPADKEGIKSEIRKLKTELKKRGYD